MILLGVYLLSLPALFVIAIIVLRMIVRREYLQRAHLSYGTAALQALIFFIYGGFPAIYLPGDWPVSVVHLSLRIIGLTSLAVGLVFMFVGIYRLGMLRACGLIVDELKESSYYQATRNPQVLGCVLYVIGFVILWPSWFALGWGLSLLIILHIMVLTEEEHLRNTFGQEYEHYCKKVPRYLGYPKSWSA